LNKNTTDESLTVSCPDLDSIYSWDKEEACYDGMFFSDPKLTYAREEPVQQIEWKTFLSKAKSTEGKGNRWFTSGEGTGTPKGKIIPKRVVESIVRIRIGDAEYLLSNNMIYAFNQFGDPIDVYVRTPERWRKLCLNGKPYQTMKQDMLCVSIVELPALKLNQTGSS
jgi:hypothetical protein